MRDGDRLDGGPGVARQGHGAIGKLGDVIVMARVPIKNGLFSNFFFDFFRQVNYNLFYALKTMF